MTNRLTFVLWVAGFFGNSLLCLVLLTRRHWSTFPIFTLLAGYEGARTLCLFIASRAATHSVYSWCYWVSEAMDVILQVGLLYEVGSLTILARPIGTGFVPTRVIPRHTVTVAVMLAAACSLIVPAAATIKDTIDMRACLFTSLLTCELYLLIMTRVNRLRLANTGPVMAISKGITLWAVCAVVSDVIHQIRGWANQSIWFDEFKSATVVVMLLYWLVVFWRSSGSVTDTLRAVRIPDAHRSYLHASKVSQ